MKQYEGLIIYPSQAASDALGGGKNTFEEVLKKFNGKVSNRTELGRRSLGYPVKKSREGYCVAFTFELSPEKVDAFRRALQLTEDILTFTIVTKSQSTQRTFRTKPAVTQAVSGREKR